MTDCQWKGVFPAVTTQYKEDLSLDIEATQKMVDMLVNEGVHGVIALGTVGENNSLEAEEKRTMVKAIVEAVNGRVPVLTGVSEMTTMAAERYASDVEKIGTGLQVKNSGRLSHAIDVDPRQKVWSRTLKMDFQFVECL